MFHIRIFTNNIRLEMSFQHIFLNFVSWIHIGILKSKFIFVSRCRLTQRDKILPLHCLSLTFLSSSSKSFFVSLFCVLSLYFPKSVSKQLHLSWTIFKCVSIYVTCHGCYIFSENYDQELSTFWVYWAQYLFSTWSLHPALASFKICKFIKVVFQFFSLCSNHAWPCRDICENNWNMSTLDLA